MADTPADPLPGPNACPGSPHPEQARIYISDDAFHTSRKNNQKAPALPQLQPATPPFGRLALGPPPGFEHLQPHPPASIGSQIPPAENVFESQGHPTANSTFTSHPPYPTKIFHNQVPTPGKTSSSSFTLDAAVFGKSSSSAVKLNSQAPAAGKGLVSHSHKSLDTSSLPMHKCFALASTRVYDKNLRCERCGGRSDLGWYYRCCHETDARLFESIRNGNEEHFDEIGKILTQDIQQPTRGPAARQDKLSPLNELPTDQLDSLSAPQLANILRQHENAVNTALIDRHGPCIPPVTEMPFLMPQAEECTTTLCPRCGRLGGGEQQSFLSLDGVLKGDNPPSAAVGFGFRALGGRPVASANIVKNLGLRDLKTGLLPHQKTQESAATSADCDVERDETNEGKLAEHTVVFDVDDTEMSADSDGPKTPEGSTTVENSDEDLVELYVDAESYSANTAPDDEHVGHSMGNAN